MDNVKIPYVARENKKLGTHSFYPVPKPKGTFGFDRMCEKAARNTTIEVHTVRAAVEEYMKVAQEALLEGNRVEIGPQFVTLFPNLRGSVKDTKDEKTGVVTVVTAKDLTASKCKSRVGATVNAVFSDEFERRVRWEKTDLQGNVIEEEDATLDNTEEQTPGVNEGGNSGNDGGSSSSDDGAGEIE